MRTIALVLAVVMAALAASATSGGPCALGFCKGQSVEEMPTWYRGTHEGRSYLTAEHRAFDLGLMVFYTKSQGVCEVAGNSSVGGAMHGDAHMAAYKRFVDLVRRKYGRPSSESDFATHWRASDGAELPDGLQSITVVAEGEMMVNYVSVGYQFDNHGDCLAEAENDIGANF